MRPGRTVAVCCVSPVLPPKSGVFPSRLRLPPSVTRMTSGPPTHARSTSWATSGRCSSSATSPPVPGASWSCSACCPGISTEQLRSRLNRMVADGLLTRQRYREVPPRVDYELTERSRDLMPVLGALAQWGYDWTWTAPRAGEDVNVGAIFRLAPGLLEPPAGPRRRRRAGRRRRGRDARAPLPRDDAPRPRRDRRARARRHADRDRARQRRARGCARSAPRATSTGSSSTATAASPTGCSRGFADAAAARAQAAYAGYFFAARRV